MGDDLSTLLYNDAARLIADQQARIDLAHSRAITMLAVASGTAALFGPRVVSHHHHHLIQVVALCVALTAFGVGAFVAVVILRPRSFDFNYQLTERIKEARGDVDAEPEPFMLDVAQTLASHYSKNMPLIERMYTLLSWLCIVVGVQVVAWSVAALA